MQAAGHIGRVGGLAVALGVGFSVLTAPGVAWADTTDTDSSSSASESSAKDDKADESSTPHAADGKAEADADAESDDQDDDADDTADQEDADDQDDADADSEPVPDDETTDDEDDEDVTKKLEISKSQEPQRTSRKTVDDPKPTRHIQAVTPEKEAEPEEQTERAQPVAKVTTTVTSTATTKTTEAATAAVAPRIVAQARTVILEAVAPPEPKPVQRLVTRVLSIFGVGSSTPTTPPAPQQSSLLMTLLTLGTRREVEARTLTAQATATPLAAPVASAVVTTPVTTRVGWLTGANSINDTVKRFGIAGTDVGVMWDNGITKDNPATTIVEQRQVLIAVGDTFSRPGMVGDWRNNVLLRSADNVLSNGLYVPNGIIHDPGAFSGSPMTNQNFSREIIGKYGYAVGPEVTIIPTAAVSVAGVGANGATRQYVNFMSVRSWDTPGSWTTNYSGVIWSDDNGQNWTVVPASGIRPAAAGRSTRPFVSGNQNFQQGAYVKPPAGSADADAGWVYSYGTPAGRAGTIYLSRVNDKQILDQTKYEYWNGSSWVKNKPSAATPVLPGKTTTSFFGLIKKTTYPSAGEMSVQYNPYVKKYVMLYTDSGNNVVMRTSSTPQGTWSSPTTLATSSQYPGLYAPMIHPWSGSTLLKKADGTDEDPQMLYWNLSQWNEYNVALMRTDLSRV